MFLNSNKIGTRIVLWTTCLLLFSIFSVSTTVYYLLSNSLRENDRQMLLGKIEDLQHAYKYGGLKGFEHYVSTQDFDDDDNEVFITVLKKNKEIIHSFLPQYLDKDHEDAEEIAQIQQDAMKGKLKEGWQTILILSGDEKKSFLKKMEFKLRKFTLKHEWDSIVPLIDNDLFEVYTAKLGDDLWVKMGKSSEEREEQLARVRNITLIVMIPFTFLGIFLSYLLSRGILRPINGMIRTIGEIELGNSKARVRISPNNDEVDQLGDKFNQLMESNQNLIQSMKATLDNVAHDLRTPLTRFRMGAELALGKENSSKELRESLSDAIEGADRMSGLIKAIMDVAEAESATMKLHFEEIEVRDFLGSLVDLYQFVAEEKQVELKMDVPEGLLFSGDRIRLSQAVGNLIDNAIKYSNPEGFVFISGKDIGSSIEIRIQDQGIGIPEDDQSKIWERLYRVDRSRSTPGLGIGLSVVKAIIKAHQGEITLSSKLSEGSTFIVRLKKV